MTTILGEHIRLIRPERSRKPIIFKSDLPYARNQARTKTIKAHCGKVVEVCLMLKNGAIRAMVPPCTHSQVCEALVVNPDNVEKTGWKLDNGTYLWR